jgi:predicted lysophospholipase L1 biosynthesis ABC-type transport system permease subunit
VKLPGSEERPAPFLYLPIEQRPRIFRTSILVRARDTPANFAQPLAAAIADARPDVEVTRARPVRDDVAEVLYPRRLGAAILSLSALFGLMLSMVGLYGVVSYTTVQRLREIGIRSALGAGRRDILSLLMRDVLVALAIAVTAGVVLGVAAVRVVSSIVVSLPALDAVTLVAVAALLSAVVVAACWLPARRGTRVDPIEVLRGL